MRAHASWMASGVAPASSGTPSPSRYSSSLSASRENVSLPTASASSPMHPMARARIASTPASSPTGAPASASASSSRMPPMYIS